MLDIWGQTNMDELITQAIQYAKEDQYNKVLECAKKMNPHDFNEFQNQLYSMKENPDFFEKMGKTLSYEDMHVFFELGSSKREMEYIIEKAQKGEFTEEDDRNLKACDF